MKVTVRAGYFAQDMALAKAAVSRFHAQYNANQFTAIYNEADPVFRNSAAQNVIIAHMKQTKQRFGKFLSAILIGENVFPGGQVRLAYNVKLQKGYVTELFIWQSDGRKATLQMVKVSPGKT